MKDKTNEIYVVTYEIDIDQATLILATTDKDLTIERACTVGNEYLYGVMTTYKDNKKTARYWHDRVEKSWNGSFEL